MISFLEDFINYAKSHEGVEFTDLKTIAHKYDDDPSVYEPEGEYV